MRILAYFFKEVSVNFFGVLTVLLLVFLSGRLVKNLAKAASGQFPSDIIFSILIFRLPEFLEILLPLAFFLGVMMSFGRFFVESEMIVLSACGFSRRKLISYLLICALPIYLVFNSITHYFLPVGLKNYDALWENPNNTMSFSTFVAGSFKSLGKSGLLIYAGSLNDSKTVIQDVFVVMDKANKDQGIDLIRAEEARLIVDQDHNQFVELIDGNRVQNDNEDLAYTITEFKKFGYVIDFDHFTKGKSDNVNTKTSIQLLSDPSRQSQIQLAWRMSLPLMILIIVLIGFSLSETNHRQGRYAKLFPGIIIYFIYFGVLSAGYNLVLGNKISIFKGLGLVHLVFLCFALVLIYKHECYQWYRSLTRASS